MMSEWVWWSVGIGIYAVLVFMFGVYTQHQFKKEINKRREK